MISFYDGSVKRRGKAVMSMKQGRDMKTEREDGLKDTYGA